MPDRPILEGIFENEVNELLSHTGKSDKFSSLEIHFLPVVVERIKKFSDVEERLKRIRHYNTAIGNYVDLLEACETASRTGQGYSAVQIDSSGRGGEYYFVECQRKLSELENLELVQLSNSKMRKVILFEVEVCNGIHAHDSSCVERIEHDATPFSTVYQITDYGKKLLEEHRKMRIEKGDKND